MRNGDSRESAPRATRRLGAHEQALSSQAFYLIEEGEELTGATGMTSFRDGSDIVRVGPWSEC